ncbi:hypothetical protein AB0A63_32140 [Lentzea sp. NPDC042327]
MALVNACWSDLNRRYSLLYGGWLGRQSGAEWAARIRAGTAAAE